MFSLKSPHRGDSNEYTQYTIFNIKKKVTVNYPKSAAMGFFQGTQERVLNNRGKRAISVRATEGLLLFKMLAEKGLAAFFIDATIFYVCMHHTNVSRVLWKMKVLFV